MWISRKADNGKEHEEIITGSSTLIRLEKKRLASYEVFIDNWRGRPRSGSG